MELLIFYYVFSVLFMLGYVDFEDLDGGIGTIILGIIVLLILSPILFPMKLGGAIKNLRDL